MERSRGKRILDETWASYEPTIRRLYVEKRRYLDEVMDIMREQYEFVATYV